MLFGITILASAGVFLFQFREHSFRWVAVAGIILLLLKGWFALIIGYRVLREPEGARIQPAEWYGLAIGYFTVAAVLLVATITGEGWGFGFAAAFVAALAAVWFVVGYRTEPDATDKHL